MGIELSPVIVIVRHQVVSALGRVLDHVYYITIDQAPLIRARSLSITMSSQPVILRAASIAKAHTVLACAAFFFALGIGCLLHYRKIVKNGVAEYPQEWFPSVSAASVELAVNLSCLTISTELATGTQNVAFFRY